MNRIFTKRFRNIVLLLVLLFVVLFLFRLGYGYTLKIEDASKEEVTFDFFESGKQNYASDSKDMGYFDKEGSYESPEPQSTLAFDQKYEKIAEVKSESHAFDKDEQYVRGQVEKSNGIIQYEKKYGNDGYRRLQLQIGVPPENFDSLYLQLIGVGITHSKEIIKNDKTNDYLELNARKASLEKTHASLVKFKEVNGRIDEYIALENRILEIEEQLQSLGVNLGDFDKSNEFCTIKFALSEGQQPEKVTISFYHRCKVALEWTGVVYLRIMVGLFFATLGAFVLMLVGEKALIFWKNRKIKTG
jgi:hypothetical protein